MSAPPNDDKPGDDAKGCLGELLGALFAEAFGYLLLLAVVLTGVSIAKMLSS